MFETKITVQERFDGQEVVRGSKTYSKRGAGHEDQGSGNFGHKGRKRALADSSSKAQRQRIYTKVNELEYPVEDLLAGRLVNVEFTVNNSSADEFDNWMRASDMNTKILRALKNIYGDVWEDVAMSGQWVEEFSHRNNKPHMHARVFLPSVDEFKPTYRGKEYDNLEELIEDIAFNMIAKGQKINPKGAYSIVKAKQRRADSFKQVVAAIKEYNRYMAKMGYSGNKAKTKGQNTDLPDVWANDKYMSGYWGTKKAVRQEMDPTLTGGDRVVEDRLRRLLASQGWGLVQGMSDTVAGYQGETEVMAAGCMMSRLELYKVVLSLERERAHEVAGMKRPLLGYYHEKYVRSIRVLSAMG